MTEVTLDFNPYDILGLEITAKAPQIKKAYKKKALKCHPDKNPDDPRAAQLFHELSKALEILLTPDLRSKFNALLQAKKAAKLRHSALDEKRKKLKEELERREEAASKRTKLPAEVLLKQEVEKLRKEGEKLVADEIKAVEEELLNELHSEETQDDTKRRLKVQWSNVPNTKNEYNESSLKKIFSKYGEIDVIVCSKKSALIDMMEVKAAEMAIKIELGFADNPLKVTSPNTASRKKTKSQPQSAQTETLSERAARQADERKRLTEEILKEDANN